MGLAPVKVSHRFGLLTAMAIAVRVAFRLTHDRHELPPQASGITSPVCRRTVLRHEVCSGMGDVTGLLKLSGLIDKKVIALESATIRDSFSFNSL